VIGMPPSTTSQDDQPFLHYSIQHRVVAWISVRLFDHFTYTVRHGLIQGMRRKGGLGWLPAFLTSATETPEQRFWKELDLRGLVVYDIGAFQGLLALYFAQKARQVICYEPNLENRTRLKENLALNGLKNVQVRDVGIGSEPRNLSMVYNPLMPGGASVEPKTVEQLLHSATAVQQQEIRITTLDFELAGAALAGAALARAAPARAALPPPDFIKIDIEGWESEALRGGRNTLTTYRPALFLEMHGETMNEKKRKVAEIVATLNEFGYRDIRHVESGTAVTAENSTVAVEGHLYCPKP
jgi:FkbM family methyltransferase